MYRALGFGLLVTMENFICRRPTGKAGLFYAIDWERYMVLVCIKLGISTQEPYVFPIMSFRKNGKDAFVDGEPDVAAGI